MIAPTMTTRAPTNSHLLMPERSRLITLDSEAITRKIAAVPPKAVITTPGPGLKTVAVAMSYDPPSYVVNFAQTRQLPFKVAIDNTGAVAQAWGDIKITPTTFIVNKQGQIVKRYIGEPDFAALHQLLDKLLSET